MRFVCGVVLGLGMLLGSSAVAQEAGCVPVAVGEGTGVYFLALGESCAADQATGLDGFGVIAHLVRDDDGSEVMVLVDAEHQDDETVQVAQLLAEQVKDGSVDGGTWHDQPAE